MRLQCFIVGIVASGLLFGGTLSVEAARRSLARPGVIAPLTAAQDGDAVELAVAFVQLKVAELGLAPADLAEFTVVDRQLSADIGVTHVYLRQRFAGIEVWNGDISVHVGPDGAILNVTNGFAFDIAGSVNTTEPALDPGEAFTAALVHLGIDPANGLPEQPIRPRLMFYERAAGDVRLGWNLNLLESGGENWWNLVVDAENGELLVKANWVDRESYRVYELPVVSPNHTTPLPPADARTLSLDPAEPTASPYGWHSTTMVPGEFQSTRGNNVDAYEDLDNSNQPTSGDGSRVVGTPGLVFETPLDLSLQPDTNFDAAIVNLFALNNRLHDILYSYGFTETAGNFQANNYGRGGVGGDNDPVQAEAQDGGGRNNANFWTPPDGLEPRMQMYIWDPLADEKLTVITPETLAGDYAVLAAFFSPPLAASPGLTGDLVFVDDGTAHPTSGCAPLVNAAAVNGKIALADSAWCDASDMAVNAEAAGATALITIHSVPGAPIYRSWGPANPTIPVVMISYDDADLLRAAVATPGVNGTLVNPLAASLDLDSSLDNEVIIHEYAHGLSNRLVGGRNNVSCLDKAEQAGEGWSDLFGLMLTARAGDAGDLRRPVATYANGEGPTGDGVRPYPYSTDMTISPLTYGDIGGLLVPHYSGSVWASTGWEIFWSMVDRYGFDPDLINGTGGNNMAIQLIVDGMNRVGCDPGFVDNRDAILFADVSRYGGANECLLWEAFAKRGLGWSADQGKPYLVGDETEAFDLPRWCACPTPVDLGNVVKVFRISSRRNDVYLSFRDTPAVTWRVFRDPIKESLRTTPLPPDLILPGVFDNGAVDPSVGTSLFYRVTEVGCLSEAGP